MTYGALAGDRDVALDEAVEAAEAASPPNIVDLGSERTAYRKQAEPAQPERAQRARVVDLGLHLDPEVALVEPGVDAASQLAPGARQEHRRTIERPRERTA